MSDFWKLIQWSRARRTSASTYLHESVFHSFETDVAIPTSLILKIESCIGCHLWINGSPLLHKCESSSWDGTSRSEQKQHEFSMSQGK